MRKETVILVPQPLHQKVAYTDGTFSASYLEEMALFISSLILDNSYSTFPYKQDVLLRYVEDSAYGPLKRKLMESHLRYTRENLVTSFQMTGLSVDVQNLKVFLTGELTSYVGSLKASQTQQRYRIQFSQKGSQLFLKSFEGAKE